MKTVPLERLHELFRLDHETGKVYRKVDSLTGRGKGRLNFAAGTELGWLRDNGYMDACVDNVRIRLHRIVFAMANGRWPAKGVDHINGNPLDNRPCNLREATHAENMRNKKCHAKSGLKGAYFNSLRGRWYSRIMVDRKNKSLGYFDTAEEAATAYQRASRELHGDFARPA